MRPCERRKDADEEGEEKAWHGRLLLRRMAHRTSPAISRGRSAESYYSGDARVYNGAMWEHAFLRTILYLVGMVVFWGGARFLSGAISAAILAWKRRGGRHYQPGPVYKFFFTVR